MKTLAFVALILVTVGLLSASPPSDTSPSEQVLLESQVQEALGITPTGADVLGPLADVMKHVADKPEDFADGSLIPGDDLKRLVDALNDGDKTGQLRSVLIDGARMGNVKAAENDWKYGVGPSPWWTVMGYLELRAKQIKGTDPQESIRFARAAVLLAAEYDFCVDGNLVILSLTRTVHGAVTGDEFLGLLGIDEKHQKVLQHLGEVPQEWLNYQDARAVMRKWAANRSPMDPAMIPKMIEILEAWKKLAVTKDMQLDFLYSHIGPALRKTRHINDVQAAAAIESFLTQWQKENKDPQVAKWLDETLKDVTAESGQDIKK